MIWLDAGPGADLGPATGYHRQMPSAQQPRTEHQFTEHEFSQREFAKGHGTENDFVILPTPTASMSSHPGRRPRGCATAGPGSGRTACCGWSVPPRSPAPR